MFWKVWKRRTHGLWSGVQTSIWMAGSSHNPLELLHAICIRHLQKNHQAANALVRTLLASSPWQGSIIETDDFVRNMCTNPIFCSSSQNFSVMVHSASATTWCLCTSLTTCLNIWVQSCALGGCHRGTGCAQLCCVSAHQKFFGELSKNGFFTAAPWLKLFEILKFPLERLACCSFDPLWCGRSLALWC